MDDALLVRLLERLGDLTGDGQQLSDRNRPAGEAVAEVLALDVLHGEERDARILVQAVDRGDVGVVEGGEQLGFACEACEAGGVLREPGGEDLDGDLPAERVVGGLPHLAHAALPDLPGEVVVEQGLTGPQRRALVRGVARSLGHDLADRIVRGKVVFEERLDLAAERAIVLAQLVHPRGSRDCFEVDDLVENGARALPARRVRVCHR